MTTPMYEFPRLEISSGSGQVRAQIIGKSALAKKLQSFLKLQEIISEFAGEAAGINLSRHSDFVYWFLTQNSRKLPHILGNYLKSSQAKLIIISDELITYELNELIAQVLDAGIDSCWIFVKDIYGPAVGETPLSSIWRDLKSKFRINLPDNDDAEIYPIYIDDAASAIIKISFSTQTYGRTFYISGIDKTTILSFSYRLREEVIRQTQKLPPINYTQANFSPPFTVHGSLFTVHDVAATRDFLSWRPETDLSEGLKKLVSSINPAGGARGDPARAPEAISEDVGAGWSATGPASAKLAPKLKKKTTFHFRRAFVFPLVLATLSAAAILSLPPMLDRFAARLAVDSPDRLDRLEPIFILFDRTQKFDEFRQIAALNVKQLEISGLVGKFLRSIFSDSSDSPTETLNLLDSQSTSLLKLLPSGETRHTLNLARELIPAVRQVIAGERKKTFLIVFQNSAELRPTGGFISSVAFVTLQKGKILDVDYQSVYQLDSQLVGEESPPEQIKNHLAETNWLIRDANWAVDGRLASQKIESLIERSTGRHIDGTIMLTTPALQSILAKTEEITGSDGPAWNQLNAVERLVYHDRVDTQTGQRQDPLISLAKAVEEFIKTSPNRYRVVSGILTAIAQNNLLINSSDPAIAQIVNNLRVDGSLPQTACPPELNSAGCLSDQISIVDANLGVNKADHFMIKEHDIGVSLSTGNQVSSAITLRYHNSAETSAYPAGTYRNYVRVYLPQDSIIASVVRLSPDGLVAVPTDNSLEAGRKVIGWYMEIPVGGQEIFLLESFRPVKLVAQNQTAAYSLSIRKQPGTVVPTSVSIAYPPSLAPLTVSDNVTAAGNKLLLNHSGENNLSLNVEFATAQ